MSGARAFWGMGSDPEREEAREGYFSEISREIEWNHVDLSLVLFLRLMYCSCAMRGRRVGAMVQMLPHMRRASSSCRKVKGITSSSPRQNVEAVVLGRCSAFLTNSSCSISSLLRCSDVIMGPHTWQANSRRDRTRVK